MFGLIIDTSRKPGILALSKNGLVLCHHFLEEPKQLSRDLFPALNQLLDHQIHKLDYIAVGTGPGSYMGIRTAASVAKTLSFALKIPLIEFCSLLAFLPIEHEGPFTFVGDAKMGQLYIVEGITRGKKIFELSPPKLIDPKDLSLYDSPIENPTPYLEWIAEYVYNEYCEGNISNSPKLIYLR